MSGATRYAALCAHFAACLELDNAARAAQLDAIAADDPELAAELRAMLQGDDTAPDDAFGDGAIERAHAAVASLLDHTGAPAPPSLPPHIGPYAVRRLIGRGGMGIVYEAEQTHPQRAVAIKVLRADLCTPPLMQRFRREVQVLARLQSPGIAHIYDAGETTIDHEVRPYLVMEYIDGAPIDDFVRVHALAPRDILELVARVGDALHHAHLRGVIHRDLKPGNILVVAAASAHATDAATGSAIVDPPGQPKLVDFGVARLLDGDDRATLHTQPGQLVGTIAYMAPEQLHGDPADLDVRCDLYAVGALLYELLAGRPAFDVSGLALAEAAQRITTDDPPALGTIDRAWRGDIETIVRRAMARERTARYDSAADLAADLRRSLRGEPITARPATTREVLRAVVRRHRALVTGVAATFVALLLGLASTSYVMLDSMRLADESERRAERLETILGAQSRLQQIPLRALSDSLDVSLRAAYRRERLAAGADPADTDAFDAALDALDLRRVATEIVHEDLVQHRLVDARHVLADEPDARSRLLLRYSDMARHAGLSALSAAMLEEAEAAHHHAAPGRPWRASGSMIVLLLDLDRSNDAHDYARSMLDRARRDGDPGRISVSERFLAMTLIALERFDDAEAVFHTALARRDALGDVNSGERFALRNRLPDIRIGQGRFADAEALLHDLRAASVDLWEEAYPITFDIDRRLGIAIAHQGEPARAEPHLRRAYDGRRAWYGTSHMDTLEAATTLAGVLIDLGRHADAETLLARSLVFARDAIEPRPRIIAALEQQRARLEAVQRRRPAPGDARR